MRIVLGFWRRLAWRKAMGLVFTSLGLAGCTPSACSVVEPAHVPPVTEAVPAADR